MQPLTFLTDDLRNSSLYKRIEDDFMGGIQPGRVSYNETTAIVYKPIIMAFLFCKQVRVEVNSFDGSPEEQIIDGTKYIPMYVEGFLTGRSFFQKHYGVSPDVEYSENYVKTIKHHFCDNGIVPWSGWYQPDMLGSIGHRELRNYGYQAGILSAVEQLAARNKAIRDAIEPCMHRKYSPAVNKYKPNYTVERINGSRVNKEIPNPKLGRKSKTDYPKSGFDIYIDESYQQRNKLIEYLTANYTDKKAGYLVPMVYALVRLEAISRSKISGLEHTEIHRALKVTFGNIGARSSIAAALHLHEPEDASEKHKQKINKHYQQIKSFLEGKKLA